MTDKWNLVIDVAECENCNNCVLAAKDELVGNDFAGYSAPHAAQGQGVIRIDRKTRGTAPMVDAAYLPRLCNHCDDAPCIRAAADGSVTQRADGIVLIDPVKAKGRRDLVDACPYGAIVWNEEQQLPQSWFFDAHLLDQGSKAPRCVSVCPTRAIEAVKTSDQGMSERARRDGLRTLRPELNTRPRVYYRNLGRFDHLFIGGSVTTLAGARIECVEGADVALQRDGAVLTSQRTDAFGDFKFDGLPPGSGAYEIRVRHVTTGSAALSLTLGEDSLHLGDIALASG